MENCLCKSKVFFNSKYVYKIFQKNKSSNRESEIYNIINVSNKNVKRFFPK